MPVQRAEGYWNLGLDFLDSGNYIAANRSLIKAFGLHVAVIIGELASEAKYWKKRVQHRDRQVRGHGPIRQPHEVR